MQTDHNNNDPILGPECANNPLASSDLLGWFIAMLAIIGLVFALI